MKDTTRIVGKLEEAEDAHSKALEEALEFEFSVGGSTDIYSISVHSI
jgi:hypothetical protein